MVGPLEAAACLADDLLAALDCLPGSSGDGGGEEEEEELEWLSNKEAFPSLETSFEAAGVAATGVAAAAAAQLSAPARPRSKRPRRRRRVLGPVVAPGARRRRCRHCETEETPQWRAGPEGPKTLCNACGVRYKSGRLVPEYRPAASPSFSAAVHSNSHRRILEMRRRRGAKM